MHAIDFLPIHPPQQTYQSINQPMNQPPRIDPEETDHEATAGGGARQQLIPKEASAQ